MRGDIYLATRREFFMATDSGGSNLGPHGRSCIAGFSVRSYRSLRSYLVTMPRASLIATGWSQTSKLAKKRARASIDSAAFLDAAQEVPK